MTKEQARKIAEKIVSRMTVEEKASQLLYNSPAIERLGIHEYNWWNESSHGVARAGTATVFPHAIALAATFDPQQVEVVSDIISTEARIKYNEHVKEEDYDIYKGLTFWAPNINIFRDPRWGRGQETFGEDPFLSAEMGKHFIHGLQGEGEFLKATACSKHYAGHSGPESDRHGFNAEISMKDLHETYLPAFEKTVKAGVKGVMGAYNRTNGDPCCAHPYLIGKVLRGDWGFDGYFTSDCGALMDIYTGHKYVDSVPEAAAVALKATCDLNCGKVFNSLMDAYELDLIEESDLDAAVIRLYTIRAELGEFEEVRPYQDIPYELLDGKEHNQVNLETARESLVLLKNEDNFLPLGQYKGNIAVIGPNANSVMALEGNYNGRASRNYTAADGIRRIFENEDCNVRVEEGSLVCLQGKDNWAGFANMLSDGAAAAAHADLSILVLGLDRQVEGEETGMNDDYTAGGDKRILGLPQTQRILAEKVCEKCENVIVVLMAGSSIDLGEKVRSHAKAILQAWYPGSMGGLAIAQLIRGDYSPSGKLPVTFYPADYQFPDIKDYAMKNRTYRFMEKPALYPFGYGLSYTAFEYKDGCIEEKTDETVKLSLRIRNTGRRAGKEKIQVYAHYEDSRVSTPNFQLCGLKTIELQSGEEQSVEMVIDRYWLKAVLEDGSRVEPDGRITLYVGGQQPDERSEALTGRKVYVLNV